MCSPILRVLILRYLDMMFALLLGTEWYKFLHFPGWESSWNWRMFLFDNYNGVQFIPNTNFVFSLNHQSMVIKSFNVQSNYPENKIVFWEQYIHTMMFVKCNFWEFVLWSHGVRFYMLMKYNRFLMMFTKVPNGHLRVLSSMMPFLIKC